MSDQTGCVVLLKSRSRCQLKLQLQRFEVSSPLPWQVQLMLEALLLVMGMRSVRGRKRMPDVESLPSSMPIPNHMTDCA